MTPDCRKIINKNFETFLNRVRNLLSTETGPENKRTDILSISALALQLYQPGNKTIHQILNQLACQQLESGNVAVHSKYPHAFWPTSYAIIAWNRSTAHQAEQQRALSFLIGTTGRHWENKSHGIVGHDASIIGWPWVLETHSWADSTALAIIALEINGLGNHIRVKEGRRLLLNRQLPNGGWNYGNTTVFDQELVAMPESTGIVLCSIAGSVPEQIVKASIEYLEKQVGTLRTPVSLSWSILGLSAWGQRPENADRLICDCLLNQSVFGDYSIEYLALLMIALKAENGFLTAFNNEK